MRSRKLRHSDVAQAVPRNRFEYSACSLLLASVAATLGLGALLAGCASPGGKATEPAQAQQASTTAAAAPDAVPANPLADTQWRLLEIQSMDDAVGTKRPGKSTEYTMRLNRDGSASMRLNCNSATGKWSAAAGPDTSSGRFEFGPLAMTRAKCPPPTLDEQLAAQAGYVRSYLLRDGRLNLSLMADGGIQVWEPLRDGSFQVKPDPELEAAILQVAPSYTRAVVDIKDGTGRGRYVYARVDLNHDGRDEVLLYLLGSFFCGTGGCNLQLFRRGSNGYSLVNEFPITQLPVIVSESSTHGWKDLWRHESGGGAKPSYVRHTFDGQKYIKRERVAGGKVPHGDSYLTGELTFEKGIPLEPRP
jgi:heat shock protein HslJ